MNPKVFKFLESSALPPKDVDRLIVSAFIEINNLRLVNNLLLKDYSITKRNTKKRKKLNEFIAIVKDEIEEFNIEELIELFEFVISPSDRIVNGAIYTPSDIRDYIVNESFNRDNLDIENCQIADIACGCSGFLYTAAKELKSRTNSTYQYIFENQIYGLDIQQYSVTRSKLLLSLLALSEDEDFEEFHFNIYQGDALLFNWQEVINNFNGFEIIVGNPPYVSARNLDEDAKENVKLWEVCSTGNPDLYIPFFQIGYENLAPNGILGFITMNTFFKSLNGRALRAYFERNNTSIKIIDFGTLQIFKSKSTYTCVCFIEKTERNYIEYYKSVNKELPTNANLYHKINYQNLDAKKGWNLNNNEIISRIECVGNPFGKKYKTRHGIATLKNDIYIFKPVEEDEDYFYLQNGSLFPIEKGICRDILNSNKLSREVDFDNVVEKVLFPYDNKVKPKALEEEFLQDTYPRAFEYLQRKRLILSKRDKGKGEYEKWFAFGRTQSLEKVGNKLFFPKFSDKIPSYLISNDIDLMFYNGQAIIGHSEEEMHLIKKIMESRLFWYYIKTTSKPYSSAYYSLNGTYIKNFGIPEFTNDDIDFLISEENRNIIDAFLEDYYDIQLTDEMVF
ncbi:N-6 DNA methylase [Chryseobacterium sp. POL2]|uniref:HsdM family class I SAM-dependent methyltransferase n=1 Tax=Chryseobacterium sp. POL2 TaxID=2713414 RepID=UPI0013E17B13|nr:N-6 DNA methylase [Chryseobacterium sp. POL2]QIG90353.1 N-6 DNA methylase [Chryseobacterium sp. POL2]